MRAFPLASVEVVRASPTTTGMRSDHYEQHRPRHGLRDHIVGLAVAMSEVRIPWIGPRRWESGSSPAISALGLAGYPLRCVAVGLWARGLHHSFRYGRHY